MKKLHVHCKKDVYPITDFNGVYLVGSELQNKVNEVCAHFGIKNNFNGVEGVLGSKEDNYYIEITEAEESEIKAHEEVKEEAAKPVLSPLEEELNICKAANQKWAEHYLEYENNLLELRKINADLTLEIESKNQFISTLEEENKRLTNLQK